jgi:gluconate:H+ symporter, GntP family
MYTPVFQFLLFLIIGTGLIFLLSIKYRIPAFYSLMVASLIVGFGLHIPAALIINDMKDGFGNIVKSLGFIIVLGTALGILLAHTGSSKVMADFILRLVGEKNASIGISITGFIVGLPVFCDSGFIVLSGLNRSLAKRSGTPLIVTSVSLATALLSVHCMIPPHPGATAAAATIGVDFGKLMIAGILISIPAILTGYFWAWYAGKKNASGPVEEETEMVSVRGYPSVLKAFLPVVVPIALIAMKSFLTIDRSVPSFFLNILSFVGEPVIALTVGILIAFTNGRSWEKKVVSSLLSEATEKAGAILVIIGAGGAFGAILAAGHIGEHFSQAFPIQTMSIWFPFLLTFILKTAQGSSTVAIITASAIIQPLLPVLGLESETGKLLCVLAMGAGSMMISHANDAYFWVISKFSGLEVNAMLKVYSVATLFMGLVSFAAVYLLSLFLK